jgi:hypothetical protein
MSRPRTQNGYVFAGADGKAFHIGFYCHENGVRKQRSRKLCNKDSNHPSPEAPSVIALAEAFIKSINEANSINDAQQGHGCPICKHRCPRTLKGTFAAKV